MSDKPDPEQDEWFDDIKLEEIKCPQCGGEAKLCFGLAFGGYGPYKYCMSEECDWFDKQEDTSEE